MKKRFITVLALALSLLLLCACGNTAAPAQSTPAPAEEPTAPAEVAEAPAAPEVNPREGVKIGYACFNSADAFHARVMAGMTAEAERLGYELVVVDNQFDASIGVTNVDDLLSQGVNIIVESTRDASGVGMTMKEKCDEAGVTLISVDTPIPGTPTFGCNNAEAGQVGGQYLVDTIEEKWGEGAKVDLVISLEAPTAGETNVSRMEKGFLEALSQLDYLDDSMINRVQGNAIDTGMQQTSDIINANPDAEHILICSFVENGAQGAEVAVEQMAITDKVLICTVEYGELAQANFANGKENIAWWGCVDISPDNYAKYIFEAIDDFVINGTPLPEKWYVPSILVTVDNYQDY